MDLFNIQNKTLSQIFFIFLIYLGTVCYVFAAYYHLSMNDKWTFMKAFLIAIPFVIVEYLFSLHGNYYLHNLFDYSPIDILIITICFYFVNLWLLNFFVLKHKNINMYKEILCFILIILAFLITSVIR